MYSVLRLLHEDLCSSFRRDQAVAVAQGEWVDVCDTAGDVQERLHESTVVHVQEELPRAAWGPAHVRRGLGLHDQDGADVAGSRSARALSRQR